MAGVNVETKPAAGMVQAPFTEQVLQIGTPSPLAGIFTQAVGSVRKESPTLIMLNSGLLHHVGSCGIAVKIARHLALSGISSCRFDFSGIGDSAPRRSTLPFQDRMDAEVCEVMDHLQKHFGAGEFILFGLCSGAYGAYTTALKDERVTGIAQIAPHSFRNRKWYLKHYGAKFLKLHRLFPKLYGKFVAQPEAPSQAEQLVEQYAVDMDAEPTRDEIAAGYRQLVARGVRCLVLMTRGEADTYNYQGQLREVFQDVPFGTQLVEHYFPQTRHIITEPDDQEAIKQLICGWVVGSPARP